MKVGSHHWDKFVALGDLQRFKTLNYGLSGFQMWDASKDYRPSVEFTCHCHSYRIIFPNKDDWVKEPPHTRGDLGFFTDGSLRDGKAGAGTFSVSPADLSRGTLCHALC
jgi:hypothetical protein